ncbi:MAG TPA: hypothetical protein PLF15_00830 [bacterium]|nr:hypothetical protein [bacterium]
MTLNFKFLWPEFLSGFKQFSGHITILINTVLLFFAYIIGVGFSSIFAKIAGKNFLTLNIDSNKKTHWSKLNLTKKEFNEYLKQF